MPANFVKGKKNEELWEKAKKIIDSGYKDIKKDSDKYWQLVTGVYKKSGGEIASSNENVYARKGIIDTLFEKRKIEEGIYDVTNLDDANSYYIITEPVSMYIPTGSVTTNPYLGTSDPYEMSFKRILPTKGDEIHNLIGGTYYVSQKTKDLVPVLAQLPTRTPLLGRTMIGQKFDMRGLQKIEKSKILV